MEQRVSYGQLNQSRKRFGLHSIRTKIALVVLIVTAIALGIVVFLNTFLLENYYHHRKEMNLKRMYSLILKASEEQEFDEEFRRESRALSEKYNVSMIIMNYKQDIALGALSGEREYRILMDYAFGGPRNSVVSVLEEKDGYVLQKVEEPNHSAAFLEMWGVLPDGNMFLMRTALESVSESVKVMNTFLGFAGLGALGIALIAGFLLARRVSKPVLQLSDLSMQMGALDFSARYEGSNKDEIGVLGENMNLMSENLQKTISDLKNANLELQKDIASRELAEDKRREFVSSVSHELKTPIALIQGYAEALEEGIADSPESRQYYVDVIRDEANKMHELVMNLLELSRLEAGAEQPDIERFDIVTMIRNLLSRGEFLTHDEEIIVRFDDSQPIYVWSDEFRIEQVLKNYISNAFHYVSGEKTIEVKVTALGEGKVRVSVFNSGEPIPEAIIPNLWEKFYKADSSRSREYGGSGVGLSIVKAIAESLQLDYGVTNYENGVAFYVDLDSK